MSICKIKAFFQSHLETFYNDFHNHFHKTPHSKSVIKHWEDKIRLFIILKQTDSSTSSEAMAKWVEQVILWLEGRWTPAVSMSRWDTEPQITPHAVPLVCEWFLNSQIYY